MTPERIADIRAKYAELDARMSWFSQQNDYGKTVTIEMLMNAAKTIPGLLDEIERLRADAHRQAVASGGVGEGE